MATAESRARDWMQRDVRSVRPDLAVVELDRAFLDAGVTGLPVVEGGALVGVVSRSDVVRQLCVERSLSEALSAYYSDVSPLDLAPAESLEDIGRRMGSRLEELRVGELMTTDIISVSPEASLREVARVLVRHHIHRVPVVEEGRLVGILSSLDLVRAFAEDGSAPAAG